MKDIEVCNKKMSIDECELALVRMSVDKVEERAAREKIKSPQIKRIIHIIEDFLRLKNLVAYGGTAVNAHLPKEDQFYDKDIDLPDYDFFSPTPMQDTKELCDFYVKNGFTEVEGKPGVHEGTYKVFVDFIPVADITYLHVDIFRAIKRESTRIVGILYAPPNFLRMSMYLELSHPAGNVGRWEKIAKRLILLNKNHPLRAKHCGHVEFQRDMKRKTNEYIIFDTVKNTFIEQGVVFFGGYAMSLYSNYMPRRLRKKFKRHADFDVIAENPQLTATIVKQRLEEKEIRGVKIIEHKAIGEIISTHYEIKVGKDTIAFVYEPVGCHSYNKIRDHGYEVKIATIDTMLSFYLAFLYASRDYYDIDRILCISKYLFRVQTENRLKQRGLLRRFSIRCIGHQETLEDIRAKKAAKYNSLKNKRYTREFEENFLHYRPGDKGNNKTRRNQRKIRTKKTRKLRY